MYVLIKNHEVDKFPYSVDDLKKDNKNVSFPSLITNEILAEFGVFPVTVTGVEYDKITQKAIQDECVFNAEKNRWETKWSVISKTIEEIKADTDAKAAEVRAERDALIAATDWVVTKNLELNQNVPGRWEVYRQDLRDIPSQPGFPFNVTWPVKPA